MELSALLVFAVALFIAAGSPGPSVAALVARVLSLGWRNAMPFAAAMWVGEAAPCVWPTAAAPPCWGARQRQSQPDDDLPRRSGVA